MKKITLLSMLLLVITVQAQTFYSFSTFNQAYADLQGSTSINNGQVWDWDDYPEVTIPFDFSVGGQAIDRFLFEDDYFVFLAPGVDYSTSETGIFYFYTSGLWIQDRTYSTNVSSSPISYKVEGDAGSRILKIEIKNAGLEIAEFVGFDEDHFYVNYQIWIYEAEHAIEFHYGDHNITDADLVTDGDGIIVGFSDDINAGVVFGDVNDPAYGEYSEETIPDDFTLSGHPANGTVYRFVPSSTAGVPNAVEIKAVLYPNPVTNILYLQSDAQISSYAVYDVTGKLMLQNSASASTLVKMNVENLAPGVYFVKINNQHLKFIKK